MAEDICTKRLYFFSRFMKQVVNSHSTCLFFLPRNKYFVSIIYKSYLEIKFDKTQYEESTNNYKILMEAIFNFLRQNSDNFFNCK